MKKLIIIGIVVVVLVGGIFGGTALAAGKPAAGPAMSPVMMDGGGGSLTITYIPEYFPQFVSPEYEQMRHISVTLWAPSSGMTVGDYINVRAFLKNSDGTLTARVPVLQFTDGDMYGRTIEFDAAQWEIIGSDVDQSGNFTAYFTYTTTYPNLNNQNEQ